jgi:hypothetical protein
MGGTLAQRAALPRIRKRPLFEKSGAKTSLSWARAAGTARAQTNKVFLLLFVHKK